MMHLLIRLPVPLVLLLFLLSFAVGQKAEDGNAPASAAKVQGFIKVPPNLVADGVPPVPASIPVKLSPYLNGYGLPLAGWDPVKRQVWLKGYDNNGPVLSRIETPESQPQTLAKLPEYFYEVYFDPGDKYLAYTADEDGNEVFQLYLFDINNGKSTRLTDGLSRNVEPLWSKQRKRIVYGSTPVGQNGMDLYVIDPFQSSSNQLIARSSDHALTAFDWSPDDSKVVYVEYLSNRSNNKLWLADLKTGKNLLLTPKSKGEQSVYDNPRFSHDGLGIYLITNRESEFRQLAYLDLESKRYTILSKQINWDIETFALSPNGATIAFVSNEDGISHLYLLDTKSQQVTETKWSAVGVIAPQSPEPPSELKWHRNSTDLAFDFVSPQAPNDVYSLNTETGEFTRWSKSMASDNSVEPLASPEVIHWKSFDARIISGLIYRPPHRFTAPRPVIIDIHGGPEDQSRPVFNSEDNYFVNELGAVKIYPNVRGSTGYGSSFLALDDGLHREDAVRDIGALLDWIKSQPDLDAKRVMVQGVSYGGYLSLSVATQYGERIRAALSDAGPSNLVTYLENTEGWRRDVRRAEYGDERKAKVRAYLNKIAPRNNIRNLRSPLLIGQGQNDPRVKASESRSLVRAARRRGTPVWYLLGKNEGHGFGEPDNRAFQTYATALFVQEFLLR